MTQQTNPPLLLFYSTSPVHVRDMLLLARHLPQWRFVGVLYRPWAKLNPGIEAACRQHEFDYVALDHEAALDKELPPASALILGTSVDVFALELLAWAKHKALPVVAIQEVAQLALNQCDMNNYDAPFDRLFLASEDEKRRYLELGYPSDKLRVSG